MSEEAISKFIAECAAAGINQPEAIRQRALDAIQEIDVKLLEADKLRPLRANMVAVIRSFGFDAPKAARRVVPILNEESTQDDLDAKTFGHVLRVCQFLEQHNVASVRDLMTECSIIPQNDVEIYSVIKWLCASGVCARRDTDHAVIRGPNWDGRPKENKHE
ncbi:MAG TPA: hypothetical protein VI423_10015 [Paenisporosarcina sp.]|nr:hypothetical protein [Paenisporosarcina sp.]